MTALGLSLLWVVAGLVVRRVRIPSQGRTLLGLAGWVALATLLGVGVPSVRVMADGVLFGTGVYVWRELDPRWEIGWLALTGAGAGLLLYRLGFEAGIGTVVGVAAGVLAFLRGDRAGSEEESPRLRRVRPYRSHVLICVDGPCRLRGALAVRDAIENDPRFRVSAGVRVTPCACLGHCHQGPVIWVEPAGTLHLRVEPSRVAEVLDPG